MTIFQKDVAHTLSLLNTKLYDCARFKSVSDVQQIVEFLKHFTLCLEGQIKHAERYPERLEE
jgi:hypothetical protein